MKKIFFITACLLTASFVSTTDAIASIGNSSLTERDTLPPSKDDYIVMDKGRMLFVSGNKIETLTQAMILKNGTIIRPDGTIQPKEEVMFLLQEGQRIYMNGKVAGGKTTEIN